MNIERFKTELNRLEKLEKDLINSPNKLYSSTKVKISDYLDEMDKCISNIRQYVQVPKSDTSPTNNVRKSTILRTYVNCLTECKHNCVEYPQISTICGILLDWISNRFNSNNSLPMGYKLDRLIEWIQNFIICFGNSIFNDEFEDVCKDINKWILSISEENTPYILPKFIFKYSKKLYSNQISLTSLVIWDIMWDKGLNNIDKLPKEFQCNKADLLHRFEFVDPGIVKQYCPYTFDESILLDCKIQKEGENDYEF